jgi:hypothetical protein
MIGQEPTPARMRELPQSSVLERKPQERQSARIDKRESDTEAVTPVIALATFLVRRVNTLS